MSSDTTPIMPKGAQPGSAHQSLVKGMFKNPLGVASIVLLVIIILAAILAPVLASQGPNASSLKDVFALPSSHHLLGADSAGRDIFSRLLFGARKSLIGAAVATAVALAIGVPAGLLGGYYGGKFDGVVSWLANLVMALPAIVILLALWIVIGSSFWMSMAVFGVLLAPSFYRLVRGVVVGVKNNLYVDAARVVGLSDGRIIGRHILSVVRGPIIIHAAMIAAIALFIQAGLEFLGLGTGLQASWGNMMNQGFLNIFRAPLLILWPGLALGLTCAALALFGNALRDTLEGTSASSLRRHPPTTAEAALPSRAPSASQAVPESALLEVSALRIEYPQPSGPAKEVVHGVDLKVAAGEIVGIVGESGSGKTQTVLSIMGLLSDGGRVNTGTIRFDGKEVTSRSSRQLLGRSIAYIPQEPISNLDPAYTAGSQLVEPLRVVGKLSASEARHRALDALQRVGIKDPERVFNLYPHQISGGMAQRVLIAGSIVSEPSLLIADEPTTALDVTVQAEILDVLRVLQKDQGMAMILVTHNFGVVADLCERVYVMHDGVVVETNTVGGVYSQPTAPYTKQLLSNILEGGPSRARLDEVFRGKEPS